MNVSVIKKLIKIMKKKIKAIEPSKWVKSWKLAKTIAVFLGLKVLEVWCFISLFIILFWVIICLSEWDWSGMVLHVLGNILTYGVFGLVGLLFAMALGIGIWRWLKDNWEWAKEIINGERPRKF